MNVFKSTDVKWDNQTMICKCMFTPFWLKKQNKEKKRIFELTLSELGGRGRIVCSIVLGVEATEDLTTVTENVDGTPGEREEQAVSERVDDGAISCQAIHFDYECK